MKHIKYPPIENHYNSKFIYKILSNLPKDILYCVTEKIHGSNFAIYISKNEIKFAKRNSFVGDSFFDYQNIIKQYENCLNIIKQEIKNDEYYIIYGEIYGLGVQKEIHYKNSKDFICFDIAIVNNEKIDFLNMEDVVAKCNSLNLPCVKILFKGTLNDCILYKNDFITTLNETEGGICEGTVIKPIDNYYLNCGSRVIIKNKSEKFCEVIKENYKNANNTDKYLNDISHPIYDYINENRINSFISKNGDELSIKMFSNYLQEIYEDCLIDYQKNDNILEITQKHISYAKHKIAIILKEKILKK